MSEATRIGVVDIGTVSARMGIADVLEGEISTLTKKTRICNLGHGLDATGELDAESLGKVRDAADEYRRCFRRNRCDAVVCTLTQAAREARDVDVLLRSLKDLGYAPEIIGGDVEGALTTLGANVPEFGPHPIVVDNGGGSTEISRWLDDGTLWIRSTVAGCRRVSERFFADGGPADDEAVQRARTWIRDTFEEAISWEPGDVSEPGRLVVTGGTSTTLAAIVHEMDQYNPTLVHGTVLGRKEIDDIARRLGHLSVHERAEIVGVQPQRASVILGGTLILSELMGVLGYDELTVSEADSLQGLALVGAAVASGEPSPIGWTPVLTKPVD